MHADTAAIEHAGTLLTGSAAELSALAGALPAVVDAAQALFGPIAEALITALRAAVAETAATVTDLGAQLTLAGSTAGRSAVSYRDTEHHVGQSITAIGG